MGEPFFAELRRRRPDVDIVILPPEPAAPSTEATAGERAEAVAAVDATIRAIAGRLPAAEVDGPRWSPVDREVVRRRAGITAQSPEGAALLRTLQEAATEAGWDSALAVKAYHRWTAKRGDVDVVGTWSERHQTVSVTVTGRGLLAPDLAEASR